MNLPGNRSRRPLASGTAGTVVGFVSPIDTETITEAREAGLDQVLARSGFVEALPGILSRK